ncbi:unnamed protein product [Linum tenue]|uniref:ABC transporter domain-containing protein n=1 Tax=Linum tenue TaxID=586396 RepID=A0AAV0M537_9ROSI|nr:unnamed protein product [Linum tenue]
MELPVRSPPPEPISGDRRSPASFQIETKNLSYQVASSNLPWKWVPFASSSSSSSGFILRDVNFVARPGELTAIAGPSGAGKTTLLDIVAGKICSSCRQVSGEVLINNRPLDARAIRRQSGFVTQEDALFPELTVEETLTYSAQLKLPGGRIEASGRVGKLIQELGLVRVSKSRVGSISGGERRRVSIGVDLVHDPAVVFVDEPTSGLDSAAALQVVELLKAMAVNQGKTVVLTIHQPGFRILSLFDRVALLSNGCLVHCGSVRSLEETIKRVGHYIPRRVNVLEFAIDVASVVVVRNPNRSDQDFDVQLSVMSLNNIFKHHNSIFGEVVILAKRFCNNIFRTKQLFLARVVQASVSGLILGTIFLNVGNETGGNAMQTLLGFFAFSLTFLLSSTTEVLPIFLEERRILMKETSGGAYRVSSYVLSNTLIFLPFLLMVAMLYATPVYWLVGLRRELDGFLYFSLVVWMVISMSNSFVACFSALVPNFIMGTSVISGLMGSFFLFSGYFIAKDDIPVYWKFMHYLSLFRYPFECFLINEYGGEQGKNRCLQFSSDGEGEGGLNCQLDGSGFLRQQGLVASQKWTNLGVMLGFMVVYRLLCYCILRCRTYRY